MDFSIIPVSYEFTKNGSRPNPKYIKLLHGLLFTPRTLSTPGQLRTSFTTNVTISISISPTFRSWVATSHLRPPMAFLSRNSSDTPGLAPLMNVLFWGAMRLSNKLLGQGYVKERLKSSLRKSMVGTGILPNNMRSPSPECYTTFWMMTTYSDTLHW